MILRSYKFLFSKISESYIYFFIFMSSFVYLHFNSHNCQLIIKKKLSALKYLSYNYYIQYQRVLLE